MDFCHWAPIKLEVQRRNKINFATMQLARPGFALPIDFKYNVMIFANGLTISERIG
jgi:hypothetical protein